MLQILLITPAVKPSPSAEAIPMEPIPYRAGYRYKGAYNLPMRQLYGKEKAYEVYWHAYEAGNHEISLKVIFRDYLNSPSEAREAYFTLKKSICPR